MAIHEGLTIADADQMLDLLKRGVVFKDCVFDDADLTDFDAEELEFEGCSFRKADFSNSSCQSLKISDFLI